jgi:hypothetical protein
MANYQEEGRDSRAIHPSSFLFLAGWLRDLAEGIALLGPSEAARVLLSCIGFVEEGVAGLEGSEGLLGLLRGAVMSAGTAVRLPGVGMMMDNGRWDGGS